MEEERGVSRWSGMLTGGDRAKYIDCPKVEVLRIGRKERLGKREKWADDIEAMMNVMYGCMVVWCRLHAFLFLFSDKRYTGKVDAAGVHE